MLNDSIACKRCGNVVRRKRLAQRYCSKECRVADAVARHRGLGEAITEAITETPPAPCPTRSDYTAPSPVRRPLETPPEVRNWEGGPLQGDDYPLEYYEDGYPVLPDCLRRAKPFEPVAVRGNTPEEPLVLPTLPGSDDKAAA
jgi:hypothetical protein